MRTWTSTAVIALALGCGHPENSAPAADELATSTREDTGAAEPECTQPEPTAAPQPIVVTIAPVVDAWRAQWEAPVAADIVALQVRRRELGNDDGVRAIDLNPTVGRWWVVWRPGADPLHLEVAAGTPVAVDRGALQVDGAPCDPWADLAPGEAYRPTCGGSAWVRATVDGRKTALETTTDLLRDHVSGGESITTFVRDRLLKDRYLRTAELADDAPTRAKHRARKAPGRARARKATAIVPTGLGLPVAADTRALPAGEWTEIEGHDGVFVSAYTAELVPEDIRESHPGAMAAPDRVEAGALTLMVAYDLDAFDLAYAVGTDHPRLGWSERAASSVIPSLPGPDGFDQAAPLARTGQVPPWQHDLVASAFTAGFKRSHGAFKSGDLAAKNRGSHYGFVEEGVVWSRPQPGLATVVVRVDGSVDLLTWQDTGPDALDDVLHLRQNGVPLVERGSDGSGVPGDTLLRWADGNWSGSVDGTLRALRAGLCMVEDDGGRYLIYGYFTGATPSTMASTFLAYGCDYAMLLDMNALEHTYLALYDHVDGDVVPRHLDTGMSVLDVKDKGGDVHARFVDFADNRDFFYLTPKARP